MCPNPKTKSPASADAKPNRTAVVRSVGSCNKAYRLNTVEDPHENAAPTANSAAIAVPRPVARFMVKLGNEIKYAAIMAVINHGIYFRERGSLRTIRENTSTTNGSNCCNKTTTENCANWISPNADV